MSRGVATGTPDSSRGAVGAACAIPKIGFGTSQLHGPDATEAVRDAIDVGYRHVDTARTYENEISVGMGMRAARADRAEIFLTTKLWPGRPPWSTAGRVLGTPGRGKVRWAIEDSLMRLGTDYLDLVLVHWPAPAGHVPRVLEALAGLRDRGWIRHIGVSNFPASMLARACDIAPICCDQVEYHPFLSQARVLDVAAQHGVAVVAHSPLAAGRVIEHPTLREIGARHGKTPAQVALRWLVEQDNVCVVAAATTHEWRVQNQALGDFALSTRDLAEISSLPKNGRAINPPWAPDWDD